VPPNLSDTVWVLVGVLFMNAFHEGFHAYAAWWCGDRRPEILKQRTILNPIPHIHPFLTIVLPIVTYLLFKVPLMGARVLVDAGKLGPRKMAIVGIAGPLGNLLFLGVVFLGTALAMNGGWIDDVDAAGSTAFRILTALTLLTIFVAGTNLLPFPPADGSRVIAAFLPEKVRDIYLRLAPLGIVVFFLTVFWATGQLAVWFPDLRTWSPKWAYGFAKQLADLQETLQEGVFTLSDGLRKMGIDLTALRSGRKG